MLDDSPVSVKASKEPLGRGKETQGSQAEVDMRLARLSWGSCKWFVVIPGFSQMQRDDDR
jgi:hypothetical protein